MGAWVTFNQKLWNCEFGLFPNKISKLSYSSSYWVTVINMYLLACLHYWTKKLLTVTKLFVLKLLSKEFQLRISQSQGKLSYKFTVDPWIYCKPQMKMLPMIGIQLYCISDIYLFMLHWFQNNNDINEGYVWFIMDFW